jgi:hypothetical protein
MNCNHCSLMCTPKMAYRGFMSDVHNQEPFSIHESADIDIIGLSRDLHNNNLTLDEISPSPPGINPRTYVASSILNVFSPTIWSHTELKNNTVSVDDFKTYNQWCIGMVPNDGIIAFRLSVIMYTRVSRSIKTITDSKLIARCESLATAQDRSGCGVHCNLIRLHASDWDSTDRNISCLKTVCMLALTDPSTGSCNMGCNCNHIHFHPHRTVPDIRSIYKHRQICCPFHDGCDSMGLLSYTQHIKILSLVKPRSISFVWFQDSVIYCDSVEMLRLVAVTLAADGGAGSYKIFFFGKNMHFTSGMVRHQHTYIAYPSSSTVCHSFRTRTCCLGRQCRRLHLCCRE